MGAVAVTSAKHMICMMIMSVVMITPTRATASPSSSLPISPAAARAPSPSFLPSDQTKNQVRQGEGGRGDEHRYEAEATEIILDDYGIWSSTPYFGRGDMAPLPH
ncbi:hypothetical protein ACFX13_016460 [Malus domestica]